VTKVALPKLVVEQVALARPAPRYVLANRDPAPDAASASRSSTIALEVLDLASDASALDPVEVWVDDELAYHDAILPAFAGTRARVHRASGALRITLDPLTPFASEARVSVRVAVGAGEDALDEAWSFEIEDFTAPTLLAAEAMSPTVLLASFDEPVVAESVSASFIAIDRPAVPLELVRARAAESRLELTVHPQMTPDVLYELRVHGIRDLAGNTLVDATTRFRGYRAPRPSERRFDLWRMLPMHLRRADETTDLARFIPCLQEIVDLLLVDIDRITEDIDIERAPEALIDQWLRDLGNPFELVLDELDKRRLVAVLVELYRLKGTEKGLRVAARFLLGIELEEITTYSGTPLTLGESLLGVDWELGPSNLFALYAFSVRVPRLLSAEERRRLRAIIFWAKPAHTHLVEILEPTAPILVEHWALGEAELGLTTILG
jgi:phage tail-like protein